MGTATSTTTKPPGSFDDLAGSVKRRLAGLLEQHTHLFTTDAEGLYDRFLAALPEARQQQYRCGTCREFVTRHGGLVVIDEEGRAVPALWGEPEDGAFEDELERGQAARHRSSGAGGHVRAGSLGLTRMRHTAGCPLRHREPWHARGP